MKYPAGQAALMEREKLSNCCRWKRVAELVSSNTKNEGELPRVVKFNIEISGLQVTQTDDDVPFFKLTCSNNGGGNRHMGQSGRWRI